MGLLRPNQSQARSVASLAWDTRARLKMLAQMTNSTTRPSARINARKNDAKLHQTNLIYNCKIQGIVDGERFGR